LPFVIQNAVGKPVQGNNFFDRQRETDEIWSRLETDDILLLAPRRVGKTSLMFHLRDLAREQGHRALYISVADSASESDFVRRLLHEVEAQDEKKRFTTAIRKSRVAAFFRRTRKLSLGSVGLELSDDADAHWPEVGESIAAVLHDLGGTCLMLIDEVPIFVLALLKSDPSGERARKFLNWFRALRQRSENTNVRWFLAGSIGLDTVTRRMGFGDTINDLFIYSSFGPFDDETAYAFLGELANSYEISLSDDVKARICERTGWLIPFHLQLCFSELRMRCHSTPPTPDDVDGVYEHLLSASKKQYFDYWHQRLREELGAPDDAHAVTILNAVALDPEGASLQTLEMKLPDAERLQYLIDVLASDGYIVEQQGRFIFRSALLRDFWRRYIA
jgi:hypothetical protein